nr:uncharacterized mitochondrial protein AtMg00810-like [Tanacetum cinerariifolium]
MSAAKLPILNPNEFNLWNKRIEQYFLMTDYSLWEVILNGYSFIPTRVIDGVVQPVAPTTTKQKLARKNELKLVKLIGQLEIIGECLSQEDINLKFLRSLPAEWRTHTLIWRNKTDLEDQNLNDLFNSPKIYEAEVKISAVANVSVASTKVYVSALPNVDTLSDAMAMLTMRARRFLQRTGRNLRANGTTSIGFDMSKVYDGVRSYDWSFQAEEKPTNYALMAFTSSSSSSFDNEVHSGEGYHVVPPPYTGTFMPPKPDLVFHDAPTVNETIPTPFNVELSPTKPEKNLSQSNRLFAPIIEDWVSDSEDEYEGKPMPTQKAPSFVQTFEPVKPPRPSVKPVKHYILAVNLKIDIPKPKGHCNNKNRKACFPPKVNVVKGVKGNWVWKPKVKPFVCHVTIPNTLDPLGKFDGKVDDGFFVGYSVSSKAFRVFNSRTRIVQETLHINFLKNQPNVVESGPTWLFDIDTLTKSMNYQPVTTGNQPNPSVGVQEHFNAETAGEGNVQQYVLFPLWSSGSKDPQNTNDDATFEVKAPEFEVEKPESEVHVSPSSSAKTNTNTFSVAGPSNTADSPTFGKSSYVDTSQYPNDLNMPALEDIAYSNDEEDVGAEADFSNLETNITVSPIPTTRVHTDHLVTQIIRDLSSSPQTRSMTRMVKEQKEVYVCQPPRFEDPDYPNKVYKVVKALYGLHQASRAWYETLANYLLENGFQRGKIDQTLFIKKQKGDILLVQVYVDDIILGSTNKDLCKAFEKLMKDKFQMSSIGEILRKFGLIDRKSASTPIDTEKPLLKDLDGEDVDIHTYRSMIGSLMYLTSSRPDIMFAVCACARFQVTPKASHLYAVKRIFRYLKGKPHLGLWYPNDSPFNLVAYSDIDYAGASLDRKSITGGCQFLACRLISWQCKKNRHLLPLHQLRLNTFFGLYFLGLGLTMQVTKSSMKLLERTLHVTNVSSAGYITTPQMVLNSPCLTHINN